jgi:uncharacterized lipoprotein YddW (UPF0748 family)
MESLGATPALASPETIATAIDFAKKAGISDLYLQVYREGRAWFPSKVAGQEFLEKARSPKFDPLTLAIDYAKKSGIRVHAWINAFNLGLNANAKILQDRGRDLLLTDNIGTRIDAFSDEGVPPDSRGEYFCLDAPKLWLDPSDSRVREYLRILVGELFAAYPELSGLHLDFFRYPYFLPMQPSSRIGCGFEFGYGEAARAAFERETTNSAAFIEDKRGALRPKNQEVSLQWDQWRRRGIGDYLPLFRSVIGKKRVLSSAVLAWPERAYFTAYQNWRTWLAEEMLDDACLMAYTGDDELFSHLIRQACAFQKGRSSVVAGVGVYLLKDSEQLNRQKEIAKECGAKGEIIFSYENLRKLGRF